MGLATAPAIADKLIADGVSPGLPVAVVARHDRRRARAPHASYRSRKPRRARKGAKPGADHRRQGRGARRCARLPRRAGRRQLSEGYCMRILNGNDLKSGAVIWWAGRERSEEQTSELQ